MNVYLDDYRPCPKGFVLASTMEECLLLLEMESIELLSLDYDLGWGNPTGLDLVRIMVEKQWYAADIYLHTSSPSGRDHMYQMLLQHKPEHVQVHYHAMPEALMEQIARKST